MLEKCNSCPLEQKFTNISIKLTQGRMIRNNNMYWKSKDHPRNVITEPGKQPVSEIWGYTVVTRLLAGCWYRGEQASCMGNYCMSTTKHFLHISKCPQRLTLWMYFLQTKCFCNRFISAWPFRSEPSSNHAMLIATTYSVLELTNKGYPVTSIRTPYNKCYHSYK